MVGIETDVAKRGLGRKARDAIAAYAMLAPAFIIFGWFFFWPFYRLIHYSLYRQNTTGTREKYAGPTQLWETLTGDEFFSGVKVSAQFLLFTVPLGIVLGVLLAVAAHRKLTGIRFFQTVFSSTVASSVAVSSVVFFALINPEVGVFGEVGWLSLRDPDTALFAVALSSVWQNLGLTFIIVLAGMQAIPEEINEAATMEGYGAIRRFFKLTIPLITPTLLFLSVVLAVFAMQAYAQMEILTGGGPSGATESVLFKITRLQQPSDLNVGAAMSLGLFGITLIISSFQYSILNRRVHYAS